MKIVDGNKEMHYFSMHTIIIFVICLQRVNAFNVFNEQRVFEVLHTSTHMLAVLYSLQSRFGSAKTIALDGSFQSYFFCVKCLFLLKFSLSYFIFCYRSSAFCVNKFKQKKFKQ